MEGDKASVKPKGTKAWVAREIAGLVISALALFLPAWTLKWFEGLAVHGYAGHH